LAQVAGKSGHRNPHGQQKAMSAGHGFQRKILEPRLILAVVANGFHGAAGLGFLAKANLIVAFRLLEDVAVAAVVITGEIRGRGLAAEVTIDALVIHEEFAGDVLRELVCSVCHDELNKLGGYSKGMKQGIKRKMPKSRPDR
jgi:hypothetical protein